MRKLVVAGLLMVFAGTAFGQMRRVPGGGGGYGGGSGGSIIGLPAGDYLFYVGADYDWLTLSVSNSQSTGGLADGNYSSNMYDLRVGYRLLHAVGIEVHYGIKAKDGTDPGSFGVEHYYGVFIAPTATVLNTVELSALVGYTWDGVSQELPGQPRQSSSFNSAAFGANLEFPIKAISTSLPNLRITGGGIVTVQNNDQRIYGFHAGLRYDFGL